MTLIIVKLSVLVVLLFNDVDGQVAPQPQPQPQPQPAQVQPQPEPAQVQPMPQQMPVQGVNKNATLLTSVDVKSISHLVDVVNPYNRLLGWNGKFFTEMNEIEENCRNREEHKKNIVKMLDDRYGRGNWLIKWMVSQHSNKIDFICKNETVKNKHTTYSRKLMDDFQSVVRSLSLELTDAFLEGIGLVKEGWYLNLHPLWCCAYLRMVSEIKAKITDPETRDYYLYLFMPYSSNGVDLTCGLVGVGQSQCKMINNTGTMHASPKTKDSDLVAFKQTESYGVTGIELLGNIGLKTFLKGLVISLPTSTFSKLASPLSNLKSLGPSWMGLKSKGPADDSSQQQAPADQSAGGHKAASWYSLAGFGK